MALAFPQAHPLLRFYVSGCALLFGPTALAEQAVGGALPHQALWKVVGSPGPLFVCHWSHEAARARLCLAVLRPGQVGAVVVFEGFCLGTEKGWQRPGKHREVTGLLTKPHHGNRRSSFLMPSLGTETMLGPPACVVQS